MEGEFYRSLISEAEAKSEAKVKRETVIGILLRRMDALDMGMREKIRRTSDIELLNVWYQMALSIVDAEGARRLVELIKKAP